MHPNVHRLYRIFAAWTRLKLVEDEHFHQRIVFSDETHFMCNGYVNRKTRISTEDHPQALNELSVLPLKVTVLYSLHAGGIIGTNFFRTEQCLPIIINGAIYRPIVSEFFFSYDLIDVLSNWFLPTIQLLKH